MPITTEQVWQLIADAAHSPLSREQVIEQLILALRRQLQYLSYRQRRGRQTAYDEVAHQDVEALARDLAPARGEGCRMIHQLERGDDGRTHCTICQWSWAAKGSIRANSCPGVTRFGGYERAARAGLKTYTMLRNAGLKTDWSKPAGCIYVQGRRAWVWLYDERLAVPRRKASEAQKAAAAKGRAAALAKITCKDCGDVARGKEERRFLRRHGLCEGCWWEQQIRHDHDAAIKEARALLEAGTLALDTESTGLEPENTVCSLAIINCAGETLFHSLIHPESPMSPQAQALHGLRPEELEQAPRFDAVWEQVKPLLINQPFVCYNSDFDTRMLTSSASVSGVHLPLGWADKAACLMDLYAAYRGELRNDEGEYRWVTLTAACHEQQIPPGHHSALRACLAGHWGSLSWQKSKTEEVFWGSACYHARRPLLISSSRANFGSQ